jgi:hypothetical protein
MTRASLPRIVVTIDRLVLRGFPAADRDAIAAGLQAELQKQFGAPAAGGQFGGSRSLASLQQRPMTLEAAAKPQQIGAQAGRQLARSIRS